MTCRNWFQVIKQAKDRGFISYSGLASCIPEGTKALDVEAAIEIVEDLNIPFCSDVEDMPVHQNVVEMVEYRKRLRNPEYIPDDVLDGEDLSELAGTEESI